MSVRLKRACRQVGWVALPLLVGLALFLVVVVGQAHTDGIGMISSKQIGEGAEVRFAKDILVLDAPEQNMVHRPLLALNFPEMVRTIPCRPENILCNDDTLEVLNHPSSVILVIEQATYEVRSLFEIALPFRLWASSPFHFSSESRSSAEIMDGQAIGALEHGSLRSMLHRPFIYPVEGFGSSEERPSNQVGSFRALGCYICVPHLEPSSDDQAVSKDGQRQVAELDFKAKYWIPIVGFSASGVAIMLLGFFFAAREGKLEGLSPIFVWAGFLVAVSNPFIVWRFAIPTAPIEPSYEQKESDGAGCDPAKEVATQPCALAQHARVAAPKILDTSFVPMLLPLKPKSPNKRTYRRNPNNILLDARTALDSSG